MSVLLLSALLTLNAESRIDSVIVYVDQAQIVRKAMVTVSGSGQIMFNGLTGMLDDNSIRIRAPGLHIGEVKVMPGYSAEPTGKVKQLQDSLDGLNDRDKALANEQDVLKARETFLNSIKVAAPDQMSKDLATGKVDAASWAAGLNFMTTELLAVKKAAMDLERSRKDLGKVIAAVTQELNSARARQENRKTIAVDVVADREGSYEVSLNYLVPSSVSWSPYYELRAAPSDQITAVTYYSRLSQRTNEDWSDVKVILSTAQPSNGGVAPEPQAWYLDIYQPLYGASGKAARPMMAPGAGHFKVDEEKPMDLLAAEAPPPPIETGISLQYVIPGRVSLKSGEDAKKLFLYDAKLAADFSYYSYPRVQEIAYLRGKLQNSTDYIFLAGQGNTYVGDEFTGKTYLPNVAPGESATLSFGVDDRVKVKRELIKTFTSRTGLLGNRTRVDFVYRTTVENYHTTPDSMTLVEQIPVSQNKDISVNLVKLDPKSNEDNKDLGTYTFKLLLQPQQKMAISLSYYVEYPTGKTVSGLY
jgi:uncharacterized protein (TIGR02231 family)